MATSDSLDDVFDEDAEESLLQQRDWNRVRSHVVKEGFRNGVTEGEERSMQEGFNAGYCRAVSLYYSLGNLRGKVGALLAVGQLKDGSVSLRETTCAELESILQEVTGFEKDLKTSVTAKCSELATVQSSLSQDVSVCSCDGRDVCRICYSDSREVVADLGLDDLSVGPENDKQKMQKTLGEDVSSTLCVEQITASYSQLLDQAKAAVDKFEYKVAKIVNETISC
ncbi:uncharacterized protein LOC121379425 [Gigantopelta aegis]|uniref:uncharacterized protein LOC121379425 n=1 Tax=Gigantopelta aegis TaxID=1735272 RepID=UPI001B88D995|nr:uncharacterized protein LOC121379425 [Gigantopelta aegis]